MELGCSLHQKKKKSLLFLGLRTQPKNTSPARVWRTVLVLEQAASCIKLKHGTSHSLKVEYVQNKKLFFIFALIEGKTNFNFTMKFGKQLVRE